MLWLCIVASGSRSGTRDPRVVAFGRRKVDRIPPGPPDEEPSRRQRVAGSGPGQTPLCVPTLSARCGKSLLYWTNLREVVSPSDMGPRTASAVTSQRVSSRRVARVRRTGWRGTVRIRAIRTAQCSGREPGLAPAVSAGVPLRWIQTAEPGSSGTWWGLQFGRPFCRSCSALPASNVATAHASS